MCGRFVVVVVCFLLLLLLFCVHVVLKLLWLTECDCFVVCCFLWLFWFYLSCFIGVCYFRLFVGETKRTDRFLVPLSSGLSVAIAWQFVELLRRASRGIPA